MKTTYNHLTHSYETPDKTTVAAEICEGDTPSDAFRAAAIREQQRTWVNATTWRGLTDDDLRQIILVAIGVAEAKLKDKNGYDR